MILRYQKCDDQGSDRQRVAMNDEPARAQPTPPRFSLLIFLVDWSSPFRAAFPFCIEIYDRPSTVLATEMEILHGVVYENRIRGALTFVGNNKWEVLLLATSCEGLRLSFSLYISLNP